MNPRRLTHSLFDLALLVSLTACGGGDDGPTDPGGNGDGGNGDGGNGGMVTTISLSNYSFSPSNVTIDVGSTIRWVNNTSTGHTATPDGHSEWVQWATSASGQTFEHTFNTAGTYQYFCEPHQSIGMTGVIHVQ